MSSVFEKYRPTFYQFNFNVELTVSRLVGGIPTDPKVAEGWIKTKTTVDRDDLIREAVAETMVERGITAEEAIKEVDINRHLNGFKRTPEGTLYIEGRQVKAMVKEAANIRWPKERWGPSRKGTLSYFAEHVFVVDDQILMGVTEPTGVNQKFVHTWRGNGIQYEEYVDDVKLAFVITSDQELKIEQWAAMWLTAEQNGLGASRSQGYGRFQVTKWEKRK